MGQGWIIPTGLYLLTIQNTNPTFHKQNKPLNKLSPTPLQVTNWHGVHHHSPNIYQALTCKGILPESHSIQLTHFDDLAH